MLFTAHSWFVFHYHFIQLIFCLISIHKCAVFYNLLSYKYTCMNMYVSRQLTVYMYMYLLQTG